MMTLLGAAGTAAIIAALVFMPGLLIVVALIATGSVFAWAAVLLFTEGLILTSADSSILPSAGNEVLSGALGACSLAATVACFGLAIFIVCAGMEQRRQDARR